MAVKRTGSVRQLPNEAIIQRLQSMLINAADGRRNVSDDAQYNAFRRELMRRQLEAPPAVSTHPTIDSFVAHIKGLDREERVPAVREEFRALLGQTEGTDNDAVESSSWTGLKDRAARLVLIRNLLPLAQSSVEELIEALSEAGSNNGPILEERERAIEQLRQLHRALGDILEAVDAGRFNDDLGDGLCAEAARYVARTVEELRGDPLPYVCSVLVYGILAQCGIGGLGAHMAALTATLGKKARSK